MSFARIPHIIPVLSGKGGVGKSSVTVQLALALSLAGKSVGVLDIDLTGPSIPRLFGVETAKIRQAPGGWLPVTVHDASEEDDAADPRIHKTGALYCLSLGFLLPARGDAVVWRGPKKTAMVKQLLSDVLWPSDLEVLLVDTPPGTSDEHIALVTELLSKVPPGSPTRLGAVMVTTPQKVATADVRKELSFCKTVGLKVIGVVENMAGFVCPCCGEVTHIFKAPAEGESHRRGGGEVMAQEWGVRFLASIPLDGECWALLVEQGKRPVYKPVESNDQQREEEEGDNDEDDDDDSDVADEAAEDTQQIQPDPGRLVDKYTDSKLFGIFQGIARDVLENDGTLPTGP